MGEDFMEKQRRQIRRCVDRNYEKYLKSPDLFSGVPPELSSEVVGFLVPDREVSPGDTLVHIPQGATPESFILCRGGTPVVTLHGEAALAARGGNGGSPLLTARVVSVSPQDRLVGLQFHAPYHKN